MLTRVRRNPAPVLIALAGGLLVGVLVGAAFVRSGGRARAAGGLTRTLRAVRRPEARSGSRRGRSTPAVLAPATAGSNGVRDVQERRRHTLQTALEYGVSAADGLGGEAAAAVWVEGDPQPVVAGPAAVPHRMWSMSKAIVTIAALRATQDLPDPVMRSAITDAITRSDNCAIRRVIIGLQDRLHAGIPGTIAAFEAVLATAGARIERSPQSASAERECVPYLERHRQGVTGSDLGVVPQFGTAEWTELDAISFTHALAGGVFGEAGVRLLELMGLPKRPPLEEPPPPASPPLDWGAGAAFPASWRPAWKAGWGGSQNRPPHFIAGQIVVLRLGTLPIAVTAVFVPSGEPTTDNPGLTPAPRALERIFNAARIGLEEERLGTR